MRKLLLVLIAPLLLTACATEGRIIERSGLATCGGGAMTFVNVHYGDSQIKVKPIADVKQDSTFRFRLKPDKKASDLVNYEDVTVTIEGKATPAQWIDASGTYEGSKNGYLDVCVPKTQTEGVYEYIIKVDGVGQLDPRAKVRR